MSEAGEQPNPVPQPAKSWRQQLWEPCDMASVVFFRIAFAGTVLFHVVRVLQTQWVDYYFAGSRYHLKFYGFEWVQALDGPGMRMVHVLMGMAAVGVGLGFCYRLSAVLVFLTFSYTLLAEAALYQNHYYFTSLIAFLLILIPAHRSFSVDALLFRKKASPFIPNWCRWVLMFIVALPYFYGGIAKIDTDWLHALPMLIWIPQKTNLPVIGPMLAESWVPWTLSYVGLVFDLVVVPLLLWRKTRWMAYLAAVFFHVTNSVLFSIDIFPWMMILLTTIYFPADWPRKLLGGAALKVPVEVVQASRTPSLMQRCVLGLVGVFVVWQLIFPLRHFAYPGDAKWTEEGQNFSWRMMLHHKDLFLRFYARDGVTGRVAEIPIGQMLTQRQLLDISRSPEQIAAVSHHFAEIASERIGLKDVEIYAVAIISLNGRKPQLLFDPSLNLLTVDRSWRHQSWVNQLTEPLREERWNVPSKAWPEVLGIQLPQAAPPRQR